MVCTILYVCELHNSIHIGPPNNIHILVHPMIYIYELLNHIHIWVTQYSTYMSYTILVITETPGTQFDTKLSIHTCIFWVYMCIHVKPPYAHIHVCTYTSSFIRMHIYTQNIHVCILNLNTHLYVCTYTPRSYTYVYIQNIHTYVYVYTMLVITHTYTGNHTHIYIY